jgi:hypothetical protein
LSPVLFIIVMDSLSHALQNPLERGEIKGVVVEPIRQEGLHSFYADDVALIVRDDPECLRNMMSIFQSLGKASGLYVNWGKTKGAYLSDGPLPERLNALQWEWETSTNVTKLLGFPIAQDISTSRMHAMVIEALDNCLSIAKCHPLNLVAWVVVTNHLIVSSV